MTQRTQSIRDVIRNATREHGQRAALARASGVSQQWLCDFLSGRRDVHTEIADRLLAAAGIRTHAMHRLIYRSDKSMGELARISHDVTRRLNLGKVAVCGRCCPPGSVLVCGMSFSPNIHAIVHVEIREPDGWTIPGLRKVACYERSKAVDGLLEQCEPENKNARSQ